MTRKWQEMASQDQIRRQAAFLRQFPHEAKEEAALAYDLAARQHAPERATNYKSTEAAEAAAAAAAAPPQKPRAFPRPVITYLCPSARCSRCSPIGARPQPRKEHGARIACACAVCGQFVAMRGPFLGVVLGERAERASPRPFPGVLVVVRRPGFPFP